MSTPELRRRLKTYWAEHDRVKALRRQILEAAEADVEARFEFFCDHGYAPPLILPTEPEFPPECVDMICGGKGRRSGEPCQNKALYPNGRCKWHGGASTGPKTAEGKAKSVYNLPRPKVMGA